MLEELQIKALAELDGYSHLETSGPWHTWCGADLTGEAYTIPDYLTSYDAIIPLIRKLGKDVGGRVWALVAELNLTYTPSQLCKALLRATGKWIE